MTWTPSDLPEMAGRTIVITGANSGIGLEAARALAGRGAAVVLAVRSVRKGTAAAATIAGSVRVAELDLADLASVRRFASEFEGSIDILINNAGVMAPPLTRTADGFELQFGTNHLGHFALTGLLLPQITGRVVTVSSAAHRMGKIDFRDPNWNSRKYQRWAAYGQSKLANLLFTLELQRRLEAAGSSVLSTAAHPGWASTGLQRSDSRVMALGMSVANRVFAQDAAAGAQPTLMAATADIPGAAYVGPGGRTGMTGPPVLVPRTVDAANVDVARRLWTLSEELTGVASPV